MMRRMHLSRRLYAAGALAAGSLVAVACGFNAKDELLQPQNPSIIGPDQVTSPTAGVMASLTMSRSLSVSSGRWSG